MKKYIVPAIISALFATNHAIAQVSPQEQLFADRVAILAINEKCNVFDNNEKRALSAFMLQARGLLLRDGVADQRLRLIATQAKNGAFNRGCNEEIIKSEVARVKKSYQSWRGQITADYKGNYRNWHTSRGGVDEWRTWQDLGNNAKAGFLIHDNALLFGFESPIKDIATARVYLRDASRLGPPRNNVGLVAPLRIGTQNMHARTIIDAKTRDRVNGPTHAGRLVIFPKELNQKLLSLDPRDTFEIEIIGRSGNTQNFLVEVGDIVAAFALGAEF
jgi:hypothetical protein